MEWFSLKPNWESEVVIVSLHMSRIKSSNSFEATHVSAIQTNKTHIDRIEHIYSQTVRISESNRIIYTSYHSNRFLPWINLKFACIIFLLSVTSKSSTQYNNILRVKGAIQEISFWSAILGHWIEDIPKKWNSSSCINPHDQAEHSTTCINRRWPFRLLHRILILAIVTCSCLVSIQNNELSFILFPPPPQYHTHTYTHTHTLPCIFESFVISNVLGFLI